MTERCDFAHVTTYFTVPDAEAPFRVLADAFDATEACRSPIRTCRDVRIGLSLLPPCARPWSDEEGRVRACRVGDSSGNDGYLAE